MNLKGGHWSPWMMYILIVFGTVWIQNVDLVNGEDDDLGKYYAKTYEYYKTSKKQLEKYDCNVGDIIKKKEDDEHHGWGTLKTLEFLTGKMTGLDHGEKLTNVTKLRVFLARVGYLKVPGSLVFLNKQTDTLRLEGCSDDAQWRLQGEKGVDNDFYAAGKQLKIQAPNAASYINKFTCFSPGKCSHTFYVITKPLPEVPLGLQLRESDDMTEKSVLLSCVVPYCNVKECKVGKTTTKANRRAYPPYTISWNIKSREKNPKDEIYQGKELMDFSKKNFSTITKDNSETFDKAFGIKVHWEQKIRKDKEAPEDEKESYVVVKEKDDLWKDDFGDTWNQTSNYYFNSRITIQKPEIEKHSGPYECIIEDGNGVVSTPSVFPGSRDWMEYRGRTNVYVISSRLYLTICFGVSLACMVLVGIIILACPKKMEYDDGTPYTKEELVAPARGQEDTEIVAESSATQLAKPNSSKKSIKGEISSSTVKQHRE